MVFYQTKNLVHLNEVYLVEASGLEPPTPTLSGWCSNLLSYASIWLSVRTTLEYIVVL